VGEEPPGERAPDEHTHALILRHRDDLALEVAPGDGVVALDGRDARVAALLGDAEGLHDVPGAPVRDAEIADEAAGHEVVEGAERLVDGRDAVEAVDLVEIDVVEL